MTNPLLAGLPPVHPGEFLREDVLPGTGLTKVEVAQRLGISRTQLYGILDGRKAVTAQMALRLGRFFGDGPQVWLTMQAAYDIAVAEAEAAGDLAAIEPIAA